MQSPAVSVLVVDDHPALRAGLERLLDQEPGYRLLGAVSSEKELAIALGHRQPDVVILDYALRRGDGLSACFRLKQLPRPPGVIIYSAYVDHVFAVPATIAQADAIVSKNAPVEVLLTAIDAVAAGEAELRSPDPEAMEAASSRLGSEDLPILGNAVRQGPRRRDRHHAGPRPTGGEVPRAAHHRRDAGAGPPARSRGGVMLQVVRLLTAARSGTIITGHGARCATSVETEPRTAERHAPRPRDPTTISSASQSAATSASTTAG